MGISLKPEQLKRYAAISRLLVKYGHADLVTQAGLADTLTAEERQTKSIDATDTERLAQELVADLESMGPVFVKVGQVLSSRSDLLPPAYIQALGKLQNSLEPFSFGEVERIVQSELGVRMSKAFSSFDDMPIGVASLAQVHRATLRDGRRVAVKIQRPDIRDGIASDFEALEAIADFLDKHTEVGRRYRFMGMLDEFRINLLRELDFRQEARNLVELGDSLKEFEHIIVPAPVMDFTTSRVLVMDFVEGKKITDIGPLARLEMDGGMLAEELSRAYLKNILVDGVFHADPHPGNVFLTPEHNIALIDLGMVGRIAPTLQEHLLRLLLLVSEGKSDSAADVAIKMGETTTEFNEVEFRRREGQLITQNQGTTISQVNLGAQIMQFARIAAECGLRLPQELTLFSKTLLSLEEIGRTLDPDFDPNRSIRENSAEIMRNRSLKKLSPASILSAAIETQEFVAEMPGRVNRILDSLSRNQMRFEIDAIDEQTLVEGFQKVANRITTGLVLAALIIGAAMLMRIETSFRLGGYPGLAILCFVAAAGGGFWLVITTFLADRASTVRAKT
ncbi:MAG: AarF/UbiB family protein [Armatimonas sp.]